VNTHYPLNLLGSVSGMAMKRIAGAMPVARRELDLLGRDQAFDRPDSIQQLRMLADPANF
jgi:hypothetical protein